MALTKLKLDTMATGTLPDANIPDNITITGAQTGITQVGTLTEGTWNGSIIGSSYLDADTAYLSGTQTFTGNKTFSGIFTSKGIDDNATSTAITIDSTGKVDIDSTSYEVLKINRSTGASSFGGYKAGVKQGQIDFNSLGVQIYDHDGAGSIVLEDGGNVGIGTAAGTKLDIGGMADPVLRIKSDAGGDPELRFDAAAANRSARIKFYDNGSIVGGFIDYLHNGDKMNFGAGSSSGVTMTIGDGVVGIGTTGPSGALLDIARGGYTNAQTHAIRIGADLGGVSTRTDNTRKMASIVATHYDNEADDITIARVDANTSATTIVFGGSTEMNGATQLRFYTAPTTTGTPLQRLTIDSSGNATFSEQVDISTSSTGCLQVITSGTGSAPNDGKIYVSKNSSSDWSIKCIAGNDNYGIFTYGAGTYALAVYKHDVGYRGRIDYNGNFYSTDGTINDIDSDKRLKENVSNADSQWQLLKDLPLQKFKWIDRRHGEAYSHGWIAQEVQEKYPNLVEKVPQSKEDIMAGLTDEEYLTVKTGTIQRLSLKALQEAMERIEGLESKVEALENA